MSNTFITPTIVAREALMILKNNLVMGNLVHRDYEREFQRGRGATVNIRKPATFTAQEFTTTTSVQNVTESYVAATLDHHLDVSFDMTTQDWNCNLDDLSRRVIQPAVVAIAEKIDEELCTLYKRFGRSYGTAGTTPDTLDDIWQIAGQLNLNKCPTRDRRLVLDPAAAAKLGPVIAMAEAARSDLPAVQALRDARLGRIAGFDIYQDQHVQYCSNASADTVCAIDLEAGYAAAVTAIHLDGLSDALAVGDLIQIAHGGATGTVTYAIKTAGALDTNDQDVTLAEGLKAAVLNDAVVTIIQAHRANIAFHKNAIGLICRPLAKPEGAARANWVEDPDSGLALRVVFDYDSDTKVDQVSVDCLVGFVNLYDDLGARLLG